MTSQERRELIQRYRDGYRVLEEAVRGASDAQLDRRPQPGKWNAREIVHHLADSEMISAIRLRMLIAEDAPAIHAYDQAEYPPRRLKYDWPIAGSLQALRFARETTADILDRLTPEEWQRAERIPSMALIRWKVGCASVPVMRTLMLRRFWAAEEWVNR